MAPQVAIRCHTLSTRYTPKLRKSSMKLFATSGALLLYLGVGQLENSIDLQRGKHRASLFLQSQRIVNHFCDKQYIDKSVQKGFMEKISGCIEHTDSLKETWNTNRDNLANTYRMPRGQSPTSNSLHNGIMFQTIFVSCLQLP